MTKTQKLIAVLSDGRSKTIKDLERRTGLSSVSARVSELWANGYPIVGFYRNETYRYKMIEPSKNMKAQGFKTLADVQKEVA